MGFQPTPESMPPPNVNYQQNSTIGLPPNVHPLVSSLSEQHSVPPYSYQKSN